MRWSEKHLCLRFLLRCIVTPPPATHYSDFDYKVIGYQGKLDREDTVRSSITRSRVER